MTSLVSMHLYISNGTPPALFLFTDLKCQPTDQRCRPQKASAPRAEPSRAEPSCGSQPGMRAAPPGWKDWLAALLRSVDGARPSSPWAQSSSSVGADGRPGDLCGPGSAVTHRHGPAGRSSTRSGRTRDSSTRQPLGKVLVKSRKTAHKSQAGGSHLKMPVPYISHSLPVHVELVTIRKESGTKLRGNCTQEIFS